LDSKNFFGLADLAIIAIASKGTDDCKQAFRRLPSLLSDNNRDLKGLSEASVAVPKVPRTTTLIAAVSPLLVHATTIELITYGCRSSP